MSVVVPAIDRAPQGARLDGCYRPLEPSDITSLARLFLLAYRRKDQQPSRALCAGFERLFFSEARVDSQGSRSIAYVSAGGDVQGFFGTYPRQFRCAGRPVAGILLGQLMVHPQVRRQGVARKITELILSGAQQLTYTTTASVPASNRMLRQLGFWNPSYAGMRWRIALEPGGFRNRLPGTRMMLRRRFPRCGAIRGRPFEGSAEWCQVRERVLEDITLHSAWQPASAGPLWGLLESTTARGRFQTVVLEQFGEALGWALFFVSRDRQAKIVELAAATGQEHEVVAALMHWAVRHNLAGVRGPCTGPQMTTALVHHGARLEHSLSGTVFHSSHDGMRRALLNGEFFLSEADGESWLHFCD